MRVSRALLLPVFIALAATAAGAEKPFEGVVAAKDAKAGTLTIEEHPTSANPKGERITARARPGDLAIYSKGDPIRGFVAGTAGEPFLDNLWPANPVEQQIMRSVNMRLRRDTANRGPDPYRSIGERMPDFALWDQQGHLLQTDALQGHPLVMTFIFTRCTDPNMCPATTLRMSQLQDAARRKGLKDARFIAFSLDPEYDTPGVLHAYADTYGIEPDTFYFLTGDPQAMKDLRAQLAVLEEKDPTLIIKHTIRTVIVDAGGKIVYEVPGSGWDLDDFLSRLEKAAK